MLNYTAVFEPAHTFVSSMGRLKYLTPIYQALEDSGNHDLGVTWFNENKSFYSPIAVSSIANLLSVPESELNLKPKVRYNPNAQQGTADVFI